MEKQHNCKLCFEEFSQNIRPRCLTCGHSFCTNCITELLEGGKLSCPKCKEELYASVSTEFPINYDLEENILSSNGSLVTIDCETMDCEDLANAKSKQMKTLIDDQKKGILKLINDSEGLQSQMKEYDVFLLSKKAKYEEVGQKITDLTLLNEDILKHLDEEQKKVTEMMTDVEGHRQGVKQKLPLVDSATGTASVVSAIAAIDQRVVNLEEWSEMCQHQLPELRLSTLEKMLLRTLNTLSLVDKIGAIHGKGALTLEVLQNMSDPLKKALEEGQVYAVQSVKGKDLFARLSLEKDELYLHNMQPKEPAGHILTIQQSDLLGILDEEFTDVFMDLFWDGAVKGRVHIILSPYTPMGHQFRILCTGEQGMSYANSKFISITNKNSNNEYINGGDYQFNNGTGGASLIQGLKKDDALYSRMLSAGVVFATQDVGEGPKSAQFSIVTSAVNTDSDNNVFGQVQDGFYVLKDAAKTTITDVEIVGCGVRLPIDIQSGTIHHHRRQCCQLKLGGLSVKPPTVGPVL